MAYTKCPHCSTAHLDNLTRSSCNKSQHVCSSCNQSWVPHDTSSGNPLAVFQPRLHGNRLLFSDTDSTSTLLSVVVSQLQTLVVEPSFLGQVSQLTFVDPDEEMAHIVSLARGSSADFRVVRRHGVEVVVRTAGGGSE